MANIYQGNNLLAHLEFLGVTCQVYIRYADDAIGTNMTDTYTNQQYVGFYSGTEASINPTDYTWAKFVGDIVDGSITTSKLADGGVTTAKVGDSAITTVKLADSSVNLAKQDITYSDQTLDFNYWSPVSNASPFICSQTIPSPFVLDDTDEVSLIANYLDLATYGLMISEATTDTITIVATSIPEIDLNVTIKVVK